MSVVAMLGATPFVSASAQSVVIGTTGSGGIGGGFGGNGGAGGIGGGGGGGSDGAPAGGGGGGYGAGGGGAGFAPGSSSGGAGGPGKGGDGGSDHSGNGGSGNNGGGSGANGMRGLEGPYVPKIGGSALAGVAEGSTSGGLTSATFAADKSVNGSLGIGGSGGGGGGASGSAAGSNGSSGGAGELTISAGTTTVTGAVVIGGSGGGGGGGSLTSGGKGGDGGSGHLTVSGGKLVADSIIIGGSSGGKGSGLPVGGLGGAGAAGTLTVTGGSMNVAHGVTVNGNGLVDFKPDAGTQLTAGYAISGAGSVSQTGAGTTVMIGENTYTGGTTISAGTLQVGAGSTTGSIVGKVSNAGTLAFNRSDALTFAGAIGGKGALVQQGAGTLVLTGANSYTGGTTVKAGVLQGNATSLQGDIVNNATVVFEQTKAGGSGTYAGTMSGTGSLRKIGDGELVLASVNTYSGGTSVEAGTLNASVTGALGSGPVSVANGAAVLFSGKADMGAARLTNGPDGLINFVGSVTAGQAAILNGKGGTVRISELVAGGTSIGSLGGAGQVVLGTKALTTGGLNADTEISGVVSGTDGSLVKVGTGALTLSGVNTYTGGTALRQGRLNVGNSQALGTGTLSMDDDTTLGFAADGLTIANTIRLTGQLDPIIDTGAFSGTLSGAISGGGFITKEGTGTLTLSGANTYTGATNVAQGTLKAGAANTFSAASAHSVAAGATLDLAGFNQTLTSLANGGTVSLLGATAGTTLTVNGNYVGNNGVLKLGTALNGTGPSDRLVINGGTAGGKTSVQIANLGGLGALTTGNGIEVVTAQNGAKTTAQTTKDAFSLAGGHVDAGAYEYRLFAADASGAGENWYLRSSINAVTSANPAGVPVVTYRAEASLYAALPGQLRQGSLAMLGDVRKRVGDDDMKGSAPSATGSERRAWARVLSTDIDIQQGGAVSPKSKGRLTGFQAGTDLLATPNWRAGIYVGQLDGDARVNGFASGIQNLAVGRNDLRSQYVGVYGTYTSDSGFYADAVVQSGRHRYTVEPNLSAGAAGKGNSLLGSIEVGQAFPIGASGWSVEPQLQLIHQHMDLSNSAIAGAIAQPQADSGWIARAGVRVKGQIDTGMGALQPYGRFNVYKTSSGADIARFVNGATSTDIAAPTGGTSTELAGGFTLGLNASTSLYGEVGKLWSSGGDAKVKSGINGSLGVRVKW